MTPRNEIGYARDVGEYDLLLFGVILITLAYSDNRAFERESRSSDC